MEKASTKDILLRVHNLSVSFDKLSVLENISFDVQRGSFIGLIGPNGAGKSTLLKTLLGLINPSSGHCTLTKGISMRYVPQHYTLSSFVPISVQEIVQMGARKVVSKTAIIDVLEDVGLAPTFLTQNYHNLSGGQKQRVMIARALIEVPDIIFFDEPLSGVDVKTTSEIHALLKELNNKGVTIFFVSHDIDHVIDACDIVLCLDHSLHHNCHPVDFARGKRNQEPSTSQEKVCIAQEGDSHKQKVHHHHT